MKPEDINTNSPDNQPPQYGGPLPEPIEQSSPPESQQLEAEVIDEWGRGGSMLPSQNGLDKEPEPLIKIENGQRTLSNKAVKIVLIVSGVLSLMAIIFLSFWFWYNNPSRALIDSFGYGMRADNYQIKTYYNTFATGQPSAKLSFDTKIDSSGNTDSAFAVNINNNGKEDTLNGNWVIENDGTNYVQVRQLKRFLEQTTSIDTPLRDSITQFEFLVSTITDKWIRLTPNDLHTLSSLPKDTTDLTCVSKQIASFHASPDYQQDVSNIAVLYPFVKIIKVRQEFMLGTLAQKQTLEFDATMFRRFVEKIVSLPSFKKIDDCSKLDLAEYAKSLVSKVKDSDNRKTTITYWVDMFSHKPLRINYDHKIDGSSRHIGADFIYNRKDVFVTIPPTERKFSEIEKEIQKILKTSLKDIQANTRDSERKQDMEAIAAKLEAYYSINNKYLSPSQINEKAFIQALSFNDASSAIAPLTDKFSLINAVTADVQNPTPDKYIYQALTKDGKLCTGGSTCQKFILWYCYELTGQVHQIKSYN